MRSRMSLIPKLMSYWWESLERPHRLWDQHFGTVLRLEDLPRIPPSPFDRRFPSIEQSMFPSSYFRPWADLMRDEQSGWSIVKHDKDKFHVALDVQQFKPEEINVKVVENYVVVEGMHEEKPDEHGIISRHFVRKYLIPEQCDPEKTTSTLSSDGILTITAPRKPQSTENKREKIVKIEHTGKPAIEENQEEKKAAVNQ